MARPDIVFIKQQGQSGRTIPGQDYVSGFVFYTANLPSGFSSSGRIRQLYGVQDAITYGIYNDYRDATAATATWLITTAGSSGDTVTITAADIDNNGVPEILTLCSYVKVSGDSSIALLGASVASAINANTATTGYSATFATATLTIIAPKRLGIYLNTGTPYTVTNTGTMAGTLTQSVVAGIASLFAIFYYHISEFFRLQPGSNGTDGLYVGFFAVPGGSYTFAEITALQSFSQGVVRQVGVLKGTASAFAIGDLSLISTEVVNNDDNRHKPLSVLYAADMSGTADITTLTDLSTLTANKASAIIAQDGAATGYFLYLTTGKSVTVLGAALGALSISAISEDFGQPVAKFNLSAGGGLENDVPAFANGQAVSAILDAALDSINSKRYIFMQKYIGTPGTYFVDNHTAISIASDYAYINDNRVIDKACRGIYASMLPALKGKLRLNTDGTMADTTIAYLANLALAPLYQMNRDGDLGDIDPSAAVYINPAQNVRSTSSVTVNVVLNEDGIARQIQIPISLG